MSNQNHEKTEEELSVAITLLVAVSGCTESELFTDWHQELQRSIQGLITSVSLLQRQTAFDNLSGASAPTPSGIRKMGGVN